ILLTPILPHSEAWARASSDHAAAGTNQRDKLCLPHTHSQTTRHNIDLIWGSRMSAWVISGHRAVKHHVRFTPESGHSAILSIGRRLDVHSAVGVCPTVGR